MFSKLASLVTISAVLALATASASADVMLTSSGTAAYRDLNPGTAGMQFTIGGSDALIVTALGFIDKDGDGLAVSHNVGLWDSTGALLGEVTVPSGTGATLVGEFRYVNLSSAVTLLAGSTYTLGGQTTGTDQFRDTSSDASIFAPQFTALEARWTQQGTNGYQRPTNFGSGTGYIAPNLQFTVVPEPASLALAAAGGLLIVGRRRRR